MISSELARELSIDPSTMSKRIQVYLLESDRNMASRHLDDRTLNDVRRAHGLLQTGEATTWREAVQMAIGTWVAPLPPASTQEVMRRLDALETGVAQIGQEVAWIAGYLREAQARRASPGRVDRPEESGASGLPG